MFIPLVKKDHQGWGMVEECFGVCSSIALGKKLKFLPVGLSGLSLMFTCPMSSLITPPSFTLQSTLEHRRGQGPRTSQGEGTCGKYTKKAAQGARSKQDGKLEGKRHSDGGNICTQR